MVGLSLTYGALNLTATPYSIEFGSDWGAPQNATEVLQLLLQDGEIELSDRASNRTLTFNVIVEGATLAALATNEAALIAETNLPRNTITIDPGDSGPVTVHETFRAQVTLVRDDDWEQNRLRRYQVTVKAIPFPRSNAEVTAVALPATGSTTTLLDACSATTGWSGLIDGGSVSPATSGGAVTLTGTVTAAKHIMSLQKTFAATTTSTKFLVIDWKPPAGSSTTLFEAIGDGVNLPLLAEGPSPTSGYTRSHFNVAASSLAVTKLQWTGNTLAGSAVLSIDNVAVSNVNPIIGTGRQQLRSLTVTGSARAQGSLAIESSTAALGDALVYVYPRDASTTGYSPPLRQFRTSGNTVTADSAQVSGSTEPLTGSTVDFNVPIGLFPAGSYLLMGRLATSGGGTPTVGYTAKTFIGGNGLGSTSGDMLVTTTTAYKIFVLGRLQLPTVDVDPAAMASGVTMSMSMSATSTCTYDEFWLFNISIGQLTWVDCGTGAGAAGGSARRLFIEPATITTPRPTVRMGHSADRSDSFYASPKSWQAPESNPPQVNAFTVTPNTADATVTLRYFPRWHTHAAS